MNRLEVALNSYYSKTVTSSDESLYAILNTSTPSRKTSQSFAMSLDLVSPSDKDMEILERQLQAKTFEAH